MPVRTEIFEKYYSELVFTTIMLPFFLQLFSDYVESTYILLLMTLSLNQNTFALLFMFSPVVFLAFRKSVPENLLIIAGGIMIVCRVIEPIFGSVPRMILSGLGVGCFFILFPALLLFTNSNEERRPALTIGIALSIALAVSVLLRTLNFTIDLSTYGWGQGIGLGLALIGLFMLIGFSKTVQGATSARPLPSIEVAQDPPRT